MRRAASHQKPHSRFVLSREFNASTALRIAQAYIKLLSVPEDTSAAVVSVALIGRCEIRIFGGSTEGMPLFWMELFDHSTKASVDSFGCHRIEDATTVFEGFVLDARRLDDDRHTEVRN